MLRFPLALALAATTALHAASFDCALARSPQEKAICASPELSKADDRMASAYKAVFAAATPEMVPEIRAAQRAWIAGMAVTCKPGGSPADLETCLRDYEQSRTRDLDEMILRAGGVTFVSRSIELTCPDAPGESPGSEQTPGVGTLKATWPQSASDTAEWIAWNRAIEAATQRLASRDSKSGPSGEWLKEWAADGDFEVGATVDLVSEELVTASIGLEGMGHGAAHPSEDSIEFNWLFKQKRELRPEDVFRKDSDWEKTVEARCSRDLQRQKEGLYDDWEKALPKVVLNPQNWQLDAKSLTIDFPEYTVSPRAFPVGPVLIPWPALKPYLNPQFEPILRLGFAAAKQRPPDPASPK
jgi:uncharacterized protein YecT (DUF1311 family)